MLISILEEKEALIKKYPKVEEWVRHKQNWEKMSLVGILEDYWGNISKMIKEEIKEELSNLKKCSCMACTLCEHRSHLETELNNAQTKDDE